MSDTLLTPAKDIDPALWPAILHERHKDWFFAKDTFRWQYAAAGQPPIKVEGNAEESVHFYRFNGAFWIPCSENAPGAKWWVHPKAIPARGQWWRGVPDFYASTNSWGLYYRSGNRWDDIDGYYQTNSFKVSIE